MGLYQEDLKAKGMKFDTYTRELKDVDRALLDGETEGENSKCNCCLIARFSAGVPDSAIIRPSARSCTWQPAV